MVDEVTIEGLDHEPVLGNQVNAVLRAIAVLSPKHDLTFADVLDALAHAENEAQFTCGFILLWEDAAYAQILKEYLIIQEYISVDASGHVSPGVAGLKRVEVILPSPIEEQLNLI